MDLTQATHIFGALAQQTRLSVLKLLIEAGPNGLPAGEIGGRIGVPLSTISFHLSALERAGLIRPTRQSRQIIYAVDISALRELIGFLTDTCCDGQPELCGDLANPFSLGDKPPRLMTPAFNVLFLCTRNSGRSIMAEAILTKLGGGKFNVYSAGSDPAKAPIPQVIEKLRSLDHDVSALRSKSWNEFTGDLAPQMDFVIALCDTLEGQICPDFGEKAVTASWPLPDPAKFNGTPAECETLLNELYASLSRRIDIFTNLPFTTLDRMAVRARLDQIALGGGIFRNS
jgi:protein-tyrosine-phosphatase/DNA-binding transcriptional ArsR family regulator